MDFVKKHYKKVIGAAAVVGLGYATMKGVPAPAIDAAKTLLSYFGF